MRRRINNSNINPAEVADYTLRAKLLNDLTSSNIDLIARELTGLRTKHQFNLQAGKNFYILHCIIDAALTRPNGELYISLLKKLLEEFRTDFESEFYNARSPQHHGTPVNMLRHDFPNIAHEVIATMRGESVAPVSTHDTVFAKLNQRLQEAEAKNATLTRKLEDERREHQITADRLIKLQSAMSELENELVAAQQEKVAPESNTSIATHRIWAKPSIAEAASQAPKKEVGPDFSRTNWGTRRQ